jgi:hypothetical protein
MQNSNLLEVLTKYKQTDMKVMKTNLKNACKGLLQEYGTRQDIADLVGMEINSFQSCLNVSHASVLTFENLVKMCGVLNLDINDMFKDTQVITKSTRAKKIWTVENKRDLLDRFSNGGVDLVQKKYDLSKKTILHYYNLFSRELVKNNM